MKNEYNFMELHVRPRIPQKLANLEKLAYNLWSTWDKDAKVLFRRIDPVLFRQCDHNPVQLLHKISAKRLDELCNNDGFLFEMVKVWEKFNNYMTFTGSFHDRNGVEHTLDKDENSIAYLSMEFGLHESLPVYSGGLGVLAGDYLKAASDQGIPMIGFGLLYKYGYFSQIIGRDGMQLEKNSLIDWYAKPVKVVKDTNNEPLINKIQVLDRDLYFKTWIIEVGRVKLYLLDADLPQNEPDLRQITEILYDTRGDNRVRQEILLAFGAIELMKSLDINPTIYHMNEGHSAFIILQRLKDLITKQELTYREAKQVIFESSVFTTHTPVPAGNEKFSNELIVKYLYKFVESFGMSKEEFLTLGKISGDTEYFWLPAMALKFSKYPNAVSKLHMKVSKSMWKILYPNVLEDEVPIEAITNGVHLQSWTGSQIIQLFDRYIGPDYTHMAEKKSVWKNVKNIPDSEIWEAHKQRKEQMITFIRERIERGLMSRGEMIDEYRTTKNILNPDYLTIGFARRFAMYKRADLILTNKERLLSILKNTKHPVQFVFAGKAHPADEPGKKLIQNIISFATEHNVEDRFVFIPDYDINIARHLVQGVDVWLNNPKKPMEASGTSGMKAGMNGVLNLSVLDGWWAEAYDEENGWAILDVEDIEDKALRSDIAANHLYDLLEKEVIPMYYERDRVNTPRKWIEWMKNSIYTIGMNYNMHRMLREYVDGFYVPALEDCGEYISTGYKAIKQDLDFENKIRQYWQSVNIVNVNLNIPDTENLQNGDELYVLAKIDLNKLNPEDVQVEMVYIYNEAGDYEIIPLASQNNEGSIYEFTGHLIFRESGKQKINVRIQPDSPKTDRIHYDLIKWYNNG